MKKFNVEGVKIRKIVLIFSIFIVSFFYIKFYIIELFLVKMVDNCLSNFCNNHGTCQRFVSEFGIERVQCECEHGFQGEFCDEPAKTKLKLAVIFWIMIVIEIGLLIVAVVRHRKQTIFRFHDKTHLRFVDILNGALKKVSNANPGISPENDVGAGNQIILEEVQNANQNPSMVEDV